jgi:hypothetical protein
MLKTTKVVFLSLHSEKPLNFPPASAKTISVDRVKLDHTPQRLGNILLQKHMAVKLIDHETDTILMAHLVDKQRLFVGRGDPELKQNLDIDLIGYGGRQHGVSRLHAAFRRKGHLLAIVDLNSTNGTYRNGVRLLPGRMHFLLNEDEICFGKLHFHLRFGY